MCTRTWMNSSITTSLRLPRLYLDAGYRYGTRLLRASHCGVSTGFARDRETRFNDTAMVLDWVSKHNTRLPKPAQWLAKGLGMMPEKGATPSRLFPNRQYLGRYDHMLAPLHGDADAILNKRSKNECHLRVSSQCPWTKPPCSSTL